MKKLFIALALFLALPAYAHAAVAIAALGDDTTWNGSSGTFLIDAPADIAVGNLLITQIGGDDETTFTPPAGWTEIQNGTTGNARGAAWYKIAVAGDVGASSYDFAPTGGGHTAGGKMIRITGHDAVSPIGASNFGATTNTTITVTTITPAAINSLFLFMVTMASDGDGRTVSNYAMATDNPTWTEQYDFQSPFNEAQVSMASASRAAMTATGNNTALGSGSDPNVGVVIAITPGADVPATATPINGLVQVGSWF